MERPVLLRVYTPAVNWWWMQGLIRGGLTFWERFVLVPIPASRSTPAYFPHSRRRLQMLRHGQSKAHALLRVGLALLAITAALPSHYFYLARYNNPCLISHQQALTNRVASM